MSRHREKYPHEDTSERDERRRTPDRSLSSRLAWGVLGVAALCVALRATVATVVTVHGEGMMPTIRDGDLVLLVRGTAGIGRGDVVVYEPVSAGPTQAHATRRGNIDDPRGTDAARASTSASGGKAAPALRDTAVVDREELERNWDKIQGLRPQDGMYSSKMPTAALRVGRVLAAPGDTVAFNVPGAALGLVVNGHPLRQKSRAPVSLPLTGLVNGDGGSGSRSGSGSGSRSGSRSGGGNTDSAKRLASAETGPEVADARIAYEWVEDLRYPVVPDHGRTGWPGMGLPEEQTPLEMTAEAYLILADNRLDGACCDSRALGWIPAEQIQGELYARLRRPGHNDDRGLQWLP